MNGAATGGGVNVSASSTITIQLLDLTSTAWSLQCIGTDETNNATTATAALSINQTTKTASLTLNSGLGQALIFRSTVDGGVSTTFGVYVLTASGGRVIATQETFEGDAVHGWVAAINPTQRTGPGATDPSLSAGTVTWAAGDTPTLQQTAQTAGSSSLAGHSVTWTTQSATAGTSVAGAAAGGSFNVVAGNAARLTSGNANGGGFNFQIGNGVGTGSQGLVSFLFPDSTTLYQIQPNGAVMWGRGVSGPSYYHQFQSSDVATTDTYFISQGPWASAATNKNSGNLNFQTPAAVSGGTAGKISFQPGATELVAISPSGVAVTTTIYTTGLFALQTTSGNGKNQTVSTELNAQTTGTAATTVSVPVNTLGITDGTVDVIATFVMTQADGAVKWKQDVEACFDLVTSTPTQMGTNTTTTAKTKGTVTGASAAISSSTTNYTFTCTPPSTTTGGVLCQWAINVTFIQRSTTA